MSHEGSDYIWSVNTGSLIQGYGSDETKSLDVDWYSEKLFASGYDFNRVVICDITKPNPEIVLEGHSAPINKIEWAPRNPFLPLVQTIQQFAFGNHLKRIFHSFWISTPTKFIQSSGFLIRPINSFSFMQRSISQFLR
jgi:WD40 repeat protein